MLWKTIVHVCCTLSCIFHLSITTIEHSDYTLMKKTSVKRHCCRLLLPALLFTGCAIPEPTDPVSLSGIYPSLAYYNREGECGTGAVVPWAGSLWVVTYGPHCPKGSSDRLYEITPDLHQHVRSESVGGTPANRMIHRESRQLFIGPYAIDSTGNVRTIPYAVMPGRHTGNARHLTQPESKIYYGTMEEGFYEVDVHSLQVKELYPDANFTPPSRRTGAHYGPIGDLLPGVHGKGLYSGQGVMVYTNNGEGSNEALTRFDIEAGVLAEWDGRQWKVVRRNQFTEVTGPGGICGNPHPETDPIWATGWDYKSLIVGVRNAGQGWSFYRLPKASHSYDGAHGWNTEWPRIRNVGSDGNPDYLMTMHGMFWQFPQHFSAGNSAGIRPRSAYLKVIGDFARWNNRLVFGCDDTAQKEFLNRRKAKGSLAGPGQSNSNLWFTSLHTPDALGPSTAAGSVWEKEDVAAGATSEPFLFAGWKYRRAWIANDAAVPVSFTFEVDRKGNGNWETLTTAEVAAHASTTLAFGASDKGEWIRVRTDGPTRATVSFTYTDPDTRHHTPDRMFAGLARTGTPVRNGGLLRAHGHDRRTLGFAATRTENGRTLPAGYYELDSLLRLVRKDDAAAEKYIREKCAFAPQGVSADSSSVLVVDDKGRRWRLPLALLTPGGSLTEGRICREVATERDLFHCQQTFYELPAENADGFAKIRPIASHPFRIDDYASYRGLLVLSGIDPQYAGRNPHVIVADDRQAAVWAGAIDDLWKLGKPVGQGGPWYRTRVKAGECSDPYLIGFYHHRQLSLSHSHPAPLRVKVEVDPTGNGPWMHYTTCLVKPGETFRHHFPDDFQARWIRFCTDADAEAVTAWLQYD